MPATPPPFPVPALPVDRPAADRLAGVDVLRGVAILGILVMNVQSFAMPSAAYAYPQAFGDLTGANALVWRLGHVLASGKFISIFAMLFGAGIALRDRRIDAAPAVHFRRMGVLIAIGLVHAYGLWYGDILVTYGLIGMLAFTMRRLPPRTLLVSAAATYAAGILLMLAIGLASYGASRFGSAEARRAALAPFAPDAAAIADELAAYRGSWLDQMPHRAVTAVKGQTFVLALWTLPHVGGLMLAGMALMKLGFFDGRWMPSRYATLTVVGCAAGWTLAALQLVIDARTGHDPVLSTTVWTNLNSLAMPMVAVGYAAAVQWVVLRRPDAPVLNRFAAVGRTALSCYLLTTVICTTLFYGHGFGWFGYLDRLGQLAVVAGVWAVLLVAAPLWLARFRFGPAEWAWRSATYGRWQAMGNAKCKMKD